VNNESCKDCRAHSGIKVDIENLKKVNECQWTEINEMKKWLIGTLTSSLISLLGIVVLLLINLFRVTGKSP